MEQRPRSGGRTDDPVVDRVLLAMRLGGDRRQVPRPHQLWNGPRIASGAGAKALFRRFASAASRSPPWTASRLARKPRYAGDPGIRAARARVAAACWVSKR